MNDDYVLTWQGDSIWSGGTLIAREHDLEIGDSIRIDELVVGNRGFVPKETES